MRTLIMLLGYLLFFIITLPAFLILLIVKKFNPIACHKAAQWFIRFGFKFTLIPTGIKLKVIGKDRVPKDGSMLFVTNHRSYLDTPIAYSNIPVPVGFVAKKQIGKVPFLSWWMRLLHCYFLDREDPRDGLKMVLTGIENINNGISMFIAPEGTRNHKDEMLPFKEGALKIAAKANCPIIPIALSGTDDILENHFPWVKKGPVVMEFGEPIYPDKLSPDDKKALGAYTRSVIAGMLDNNKKYITKGGQ
ncbi:MAG: 1-acyl-sn-glycerol-3-phosphate acyltransferase [Lachnospiraceae bacterium]|nr:1-acyl-sn-glycerol-3-phosphate acyltransferase [Lachnospiraceae bacterium]